MNYSIDRRGFLASSGSCVAGALLRLHRPALGDESLRPEPSWLEDVQRVPDKLHADAPQLPSLLVNGEGQVIGDLSGWEKHRAELRRAWLQFLGPLKLPRPKPKLEVLEEDRPEGCIRQLVRYESEPGQPVEGYLLRPTEINGRVPGVVAMHSTTTLTIRQPAGVEGDPEDFFGLKLARLGMVAFCPRCFLWQGEGSYVQLVERFKERHPGSLGMAKMLWDASRGVDVLESLPEVDPQRLGAVGHSLGAKEALYLAAFDERIKATVSSEGGIGLTFTNWDAPWYLGPDVKQGRWKREHHELLALIAPRAFLLLGGNSADGDRSWPYIQEALKVYRLYTPKPALGLFNHYGGHNVPPEAERKTNEWLSAYL